MGVDCVAHRANFAIKFLGNLTFIGQIESFVMNMYDYFSHNPKRHLEYYKLFFTLKIKGNMIF
jgi:hypothetical protein